MSVASRQLPLDLEGHGSTCDLDAVRSEARAPVVRAVEYTPFPRVSRDQRRRVGFTRDESSAGMSLVADSPESLGALLRVIVRGIDGRPALDCVARVVSCEERTDGRYWLGLARVADGRPRMRSVRPVGLEEERRAGA
jgi:hypothetical protein